MGRAALSFYNFPVLDTDPTSPNKKIGCRTNAEEERGRSNSRFSVKGISSVSSCGSAGTAVSYGHDLKFFSRCCVPHHQHCGP